MLSPNETAALRQVLEAEHASKFSLSRMMDISTDYADYMLLSLSHRGYLRTIRPGGHRSKFGAYEVTPRGGEEIFNMLNLIKNRQLYVAERAMRAAERMDRRREEFPDPLKPAGVEQERGAP